MLRGSRNRKRRNQVPCSTRGQRRPSPKKRFPNRPRRLGRTWVVAPRCKYSPRTGRGQTIHHRRPPNGTRKMVSIDIQAAQVNMTAKLRPPTFVPKNPARIARLKPARTGKVQTNWRGLHLSSRPNGANRRLRSTGGEKGKSARGSFHRMRK